MCGIVAYIGNQSAVPLLLEASRNSNIAAMIVLEFASLVTITWKLLRGAVKLANLKKLLI